MSWKRGLLEEVDETTRPQEEFVPGRYIPSLDGVRAIAAVAVILHHYVLFNFVIQLGFDDAKVAELSLLHYLMRCTWYLGWMGVDLFFVLSGFLITGILLDAKGKGSRRGVLRVFYMRRFFRIMPLYYLFLAVYLTTACLLGSGDSTAAWHLLYLSNLLVSNFGWMALSPYTTHLWTLSIEEQFYLLWPLIVLLSSRPVLKKICIAALVLVPVFRVLAASYKFPGVEEASHVFTLSRTDVLLAGGLLALWVREPRSLDLLRRWSPQVALTSLGVYVVLLLSQSAAHAADGGLTPFEFNHLAEEGLWMQGLGYSLTTGVFASLIALLVTRPNGRVAHLFSLSWLRRVGRVSYAVYLFQTPVIVAGFQLGVLHAISEAIPGPKAFGEIVAAGVCVILSYLLARISWVAFERPINGLKARFQYD